MSPTVQRSPSSHGTPGLIWNWHPDAGSQLSAVQGSSSSQLTGEPVQVPSPWQASFSVHAFPSSQGLDALGTFEQVPTDMLQASSVQGLLSSQSASLEHVQLVVSNMQLPVTWSQVSMVQALPSSQTVGVPAHDPSPWQASSWVHRSPSLHRLV
jgi:hypothetical protein